MYVMRIVHFAAILLLSFSVALAGFPAQAMLGAMKDCPMAAKTQQMDMKDCKSCDKMVKQESEKGGCCDESGCNAKCPAISGGVTMNLPAYKAALPTIGKQVDRFYPADAAVASAHLSSQERPPKHLS